MGVLDEHPPLQRRVGVRHQLHRPVEVAAGHVETTEQRQRRRAQEQQRRLLLGHRAEAGEHAEQRARLDRVGDRLGQGGHHRGCPLVGPGVEQQSDRLDVPLALDELAGEAQCRGRFDLDRAERRLVEQVDRAVDAAPQRYPGGHDAFDEPRAAELVEEALVEPRRTGEHADQAPVAAGQAVQRGGRSGALHADDVGQGVAMATVALVLLERRRRPPSPSRRRHRRSARRPGARSSAGPRPPRPPVIDRAVASKRAASTRSPTSRSSRGRKRPATITHRSSATSSIQWARRSTSLGASRWASSIDTGVPSPLAEPRPCEIEVGGATAQTSRATRRGPAQQPRLAEADRGLEETDARCRLGEQLGEQRFARQFHLPPR